MKNAVLIFALLSYSTSFFGQTIVQFGNQFISKQEFLRAYQKNNSSAKATEKSYRDYLKLYIRYRLKVQAALDLKMDTLISQKTDLQNFKSQIVDQYTNDESSLNQMAEEAFVRSKHDLRLSYIFVAVPKNASPADTIIAWKKIQEAYTALENKKDFAETALLFSEDPFVKNNRGNIGYITVFDLPYLMENMAYHLDDIRSHTRNASTLHSTIFRIEGGYVILKISDERPALGRIRIAQILVAFPYQANDAAKAVTHLRADSIYQALLNGADFAMMAKKFSGDNLSFQMGGVLPEFGIGKYESGFEEAAFNLNKDGNLSKPYASSFGYHIIKRISRRPIPTAADQKVLSELKEKIKSDPRVAISRKHMLKTILKQTDFRELIPRGKIFWDYTDSMLLDKRPNDNASINNESTLFQFEDKKYSVGDWIVYRKSLKSVPNLTNGKKEEEILDMYLQIIAFQYYRDHLEKYNEDYAIQIREFRDGNLLFDIMQQQIWNRAAADSDGLKKYFQVNITKYWWKQGADAIIFNAPNLRIAQKLHGQIEKSSKNWRTLNDSLGIQIQADSGRFNWKQIPGYDNSIQVGQTTKYSSSANATDGNIQFAYIIKKYPAPSPRTFEEARGLVINDYQNELENRWLAVLEKKYPVVIHESVVSRLTK